jgi:hypothetical protein
MSASLPNPRYERKFVARGYILADVLALVRRHPAAFREAYPPRWVNNVYFDTPSLRDYHAHVSGTPERSKTRVRWYGQPNGEPVNAVLEKKLKRGLVGGKTSVALTPVILSKPSTVAWSKAFADPQLAEAWRFSLRNLLPSLFNSYRRHYFLSSDGCFRLTVDSDLRFSGLESSHEHSSSDCTYPPIIELKFHPNHADSAPSISAHLPLRLSRCSKYILGLERLSRP